MSFLKKLIKKKDEDPRNSGAAGGMQTMSTELQMKYAKGVQYNMKVIIKGDRNVGKSTLYHRLQGEKFKEEYIPTDEIQVANIQWNYKTTDDVVKVEVWDVVDKARRKSNGGLKMNHGGDEADTPALDAQFVDVYKGTHAVIMVYDMTKLWTWKYVEREIFNVPPNIPVIILANCRDMGAHRTVDEDTPLYFISSLDRGKSSAPVHFTESSLINGYGLKYLHVFFNVPFLALQRDTLQRQLDANARETEAIYQELEMLSEVNYNKAIDAFAKKQSTSTSARQPTAATSTAQTTVGSQSMAAKPLMATRGAKASHSIDDFQPDLSKDASDFFGGEDTHPSRQRATPVSAPDEDDDEDETDNNPMVAAFQDDLDESVPAFTPKKIASADIVLSSDEDVEEVKVATDSSSEEDTVARLTKQFTNTVALQSHTEQVSHSEDDDASDDDGDMTQPTIKTFTEELSDPEPSIRPSDPVVSSKNVVLTDSEDERFTAVSAEQLSSNEGSIASPSVQLPDIATSHQASKGSEERTSTGKKKKRTKKDKSGEVLADGEVKVKKKTKKSKKSADGEVVKEKKKSKSKSKSKPIDPLEAFLAGDDDGQPSQDYECL